jgi:hypothetical protein
VIRSACGPVVEEPARPFVGTPPKEKCVPAGWAGYSPPQIEATNSAAHADGSVSLLTLWKGLGLGGTVGCVAAGVRRCLDALCGSPCTSGTSEAEGAGGSARVALDGALLQA